MGELLNERTEEREGIVPLSRRGIAYDLNISPYKLDVPYGKEIVQYVFSSDMYRQKFYDNFLDHREKISESLSKRFGIRVENDVLSDLKLYMTIEKRGFMIITKEGKCVCQRDITLDGANLILRKSGAS